jgi:peroxin-19
VDAIPTSVLSATKLDTAAEAAEDELDFSRELAKGMENLMRELSAESSKPTDNDGSSAESARALQVVWEQMLVEGMNGDPGVGQSSGDSGFQDKIKQAVNKLKESESNLQVNL